MVCFLFGFGVRLRHSLGLHFALVLGWFSLLFVGFYFLNDSYHIWLFDRVLCFLLFILLFAC